MKIICWNIDNINLEKAANHPSQITHYLIGADVIFILENQSRPSDVIKKLIDHLHIEGNTDIWDYKAVSAGGTPNTNTHEFVLVIWKKKLNATPLLPSQELANFYSEIMKGFSLSYDTRKREKPGETVPKKQNEGFEITFNKKDNKFNSKWRVPVVLQTKSGINIAAFHTPYNRLNQTQITKLNNKYLESLSNITVGPDKININLFMGDFNQKNLGDNTVGEFSRSGDNRCTTITWDYHFHKMELSEYNALKNSSDFWKYENRYILVTNNSSPPSIWYISEGPTEKPVTNIDVKKIQTIMKNENEHRFNNNRLDGAEPSRQKPNRHYEYSDKKDSRYDRVYVNDVPKINTAYAITNTSAETNPVRFIGKITNHIPICAVVNDSSPPQGYEFAKTTVESNTPNYSISNLRPYALPELQLAADFTFNNFAFPTSSYTLDDKIFNNFIKFVRQAFFLDSGNIVINNIQNPPQKGSNPNTIKGTTLSKLPSIFSSSANLIWTCTLEEDENKAISFTMQSSEFNGWPFNENFDKELNSLKEIEFTNTQFIFFSGKIPPTQNTTVLSNNNNMLFQPGLNISTTLTFSQKYFFDFPSISKLNFNGVILNNQGPIIDLIASFTGAELPSPLKSFKIIDTFLQYIHNPFINTGEFIGYRDRNKVETGWFMGGRFHLEKEATLPFSTRIKDNAIAVFLGGDKNPTKLKDLAGLLGDNWSNKLIPSQDSFRPQIDYINVMATRKVNDKSYSVDARITCIDTSNKWEILPEIVSIDELALQLSAEISAENSYSANIDIGLQFGNRHLSGDLILDDDGSCRIYGSLDIDTDIKIATLAKDLFGVNLSFPEDFANITIQSIHAQVDVGYDKNSKKYACDQYICDIYGSITLLEILTLNDLAISIVATPNEKKASINTGISTIVDIASALFDVHCDFNKDGPNIFTATTKDILNLSKLINQMGINIALPNLELTSASLGYLYSTKNATNKIIAFSSKAQNINAQLIIFDGSNDKTSPDKIFTITSAPITGVPLIKTFPKINLIFLSCNNFTNEKVTSINALISTLGNEFILFPQLDAKTKIADGNNLGIQLDSHAPFFVPLAKNATKSLSDNEIEANATHTSSTQWINIQRSLGAVELRRFGIGYDEGQIHFAVDANISMAGLTIGLEGLSIGFDLPSFKNPSSDISGLALDYRSSSFEIAGSLLKIDPNNYQGSAVFKTPTLSIVGIGAYKKGSKDKSPSAFIFARTGGKPLGGPPSFYVKGFAAGFGYNQKLKVPELKEVSTFPLISTKKGSSSEETAMQEMLVQLKKDHWIEQKENEQWLAVGLSFTTYQMVESNALAIVNFGAELSLALIGRSQMTLPKNSSFKLTYVEMDFEAVIKPAQGFFGLSAVLSPRSYVLDKNCHLTGGFAFYTWYDGEHAGDFVITLGGYHPRFKKINPLYPDEPRLGFSWHLSKNVSIKGESYFALTPSCVMAGGKLVAEYHSGHLRAWFKAYADFLICWAPFYYDVAIGIDIGASYRLKILFTSVTLEVDLGATLTLSGPPLAGKAHVHWSIISFTIPIGTPKKTNKNPLKWKEFKTQHLPEKIIKITIQSGLIRHEKIKDIHSGEEIDLWVIRPDQFVFRTESAIPLNIINSPGYKNNSQEIPEVHIKPIGEAGMNITSKHTIKIIADTPSLNDTPMNQWTSKVITRSVPDALWGKYNSKAPTPTASAKTTKNSWVGLTVRAPHSQQGVSPGAIQISTAFDDAVIRNYGNLPITSAAAPDHSVTSCEKSINLIQKALNKETATGAPCMQLYEYLQKKRYFSTNDKIVPLQKFATTIQQELVQAPLLRNFERNKK